MKTLLIAASLLAFTAVSSAAIVGTTQYTFSHATSGSIQELQTGLKVDTPIGKLDGAVVGDRYHFGKVDNVLGFELGYSNDLKLGAGSLAGRVAYGRKNLVNVDGVYSKNLQYISLSGEFHAPITKVITGYTGYEHRRVLGGTVENRLSAGAEFNLTKSLSTRVGYQHASIAGKNFNGLVTSVSYAF